MSPFLLLARYITSINNVLLYYQFMRNNNNEVMVENSDQWVTEDFEDWRCLGKPKSIAAFTPEQKRQDELWKEPAKRDLSVSTAAATTATTTTAPVVNDNKIISKKDKNSKLDDVVTTTTADATADDIDNVKLTLGCVNSIGDSDCIKDEYYQVKRNNNNDETATTAMVISTIIVSNKEDYLSKLIVVAAAKDNVDHAKFEFKCKLIGDLDCIRDEYYQVKRKYGSIYDRSDDGNLPPLPPESPAYTIDIPYIHSSISNNGERIVQFTLVS